LTWDEMVSVIDIIDIIKISCNLPPRFPVPSLTARHPNLAFNKASRSCSIHSGGGAAIQANRIRQSKEYVYAVIPTGHGQPLWD
jgi:hypothetical protein